MRSIGSGGARAWFSGTAFRLGRWRPEHAADTNDTGALDVSDAVSIFLRLFGDGNQPPDPEAPACADDSTEDPLDCGEFASCE